MRTDPQDLLHLLAGRRILTADVPIDPWQHETASPDRSN
jgi:hypothetical protein